MEKRALKICNYCGNEEPKSYVSFEDIEVVRCQGCGLTYVNESDAAHAGKVYSGDVYDAYWNASDELFKNIQKDIEKEAGVIERIHGKGILLDVGCAKGHFLHTMERRGWQVQGVEVSKFCASFAQKNFNLPVFNGKLVDALFKGDSFDVVTLWGVIEHMQDPLGNMREVGRILRKGGLVAIKTQREDCLLTFLGHLLYRATFRKMSSHMKFFYSEQHIYSFTLNLLKKMLESLGFRIILVEQEDPYVIKYSLHTFSPVTSFLIKAVNGLEHISGRLRKMTIYAIKE